MTIHLHAPQQSISGLDWTGQVRAGRDDTECGIGWDKQGYLHGSERDGTAQGEGREGTEQHRAWYSRWQAQDDALTDWYRR